MLAATVNLDIELDLVAFVERAHAGAFHGRDVHKGVGLAIIALDEAKALHGVEEFDDARRRFSGQLTLRATPAAAESATAAGARTAIKPAFTRRTTVLDRKRIAFDHEVGRRNASAAINERVSQRLPFSETDEPRLFDCADVNENVFATVILNDEAEALLSIEEFDDAFAFADNLSRHLRARRTAEATAACTTAETAAAAAIATTEAATVTKTATITESTAAETRCTAEFFFAETVALIPAAPATFAAAPSIKPHASNNFLRT